MLAAFYLLRLNLLRLWSGGRIENVIWEPQELRAFWGWHELK
jgi:hypothetical protein